MKKIHILYFVLIIIVILSHKSYSQMTSPLSYDGGADSHIFKNDTVILENTILDDGWKNENTNTISVGFTMLYSPYLTMLYLPFKYSPVDWCTLDITLPFMYKLWIDSSSEREKLGFGDLKLGVAFSFAPLNLFITTTRVNITFPTGDSCARDRDLLIPMGYGSFTISALQSLSTMHYGIKKFGIRFFVNLGIVCYMKSQREPNDTIRYIIDYSYSVSTLFGFEMKIIEKFYIIAKLGYIYYPERRYKYETYSPPETSSWLDLNDSIHALNVIPAIRYDFLPDFSGSLMTVVPVYEEQDPGISDPYERNWGIILSLQKRFGVQESIKVKVKNK